MINHSFQDSGAYELRDQAANRFEHCRRWGRFDARVYRHFRVGAGASMMVERAWGYFLVQGYPAAKAFVEVRRGLAPGCPGTVVFSGTVPMVASRTGRCLSGWMEVRCDSKVPRALCLGPGDYWLLYQPIGPHPAILVSNASGDGGFSFLVCAAAGMRWDPMAVDWACGVGDSQPAHQA